MTAARRGCLPLALAIGSWACGTDDQPGDRAGTSVSLTIPDGDGAPSPRYGEGPFPTDALLGIDGTLDELAGIEAIIPRGGEALSAHLSALDGFGVRPLVEFPLDGSIDPASLPGAARVIDVDPGSPARGQEIAYEWRFDEDRLVIAGAPVPGAVLRAGTRYAAVLTDRILDAQGRPLAAPAAHGRLRRGDVPERWRSTAEGLAAVEPVEGAGAVVGVAVFTTQHATRVMTEARAALADPTRVPPPELSFPDPDLVFAGPAALDQLLGAAGRFDGGPRGGQERWGFSSETGMAHDHVGVIATGLMTAARFRRPDSGDDGPDDETFAPANGAPPVIAMDSIPVTMILPAAPPPSEDGYPVAIFAHGLGASRHAAVTFAEPLTRAGFAVVAIDADGHGSRRDPVDRENNLGPLLPGFTGDPARPDGFGDVTGLVTTFDFLEELLNFSGARDAIRQSVLDQCQLVALVRRADLDLGALAGAYGGVAPRLDARRIAYLGESFGTILGGILAAVEPDVDLYVLDVAGAGLIDLAIVNTPKLATLVVPLAQALYGLQGPIDRFHPAIALMQAVIDPADPLTYAPHVLGDRLSIGGREIGPRHVVVLEVVGDEVIHNLATESLARAMGLALLRPHLEPVVEGLGGVDAPAAGNAGGQTAVLVHYAPATHGANWTSERGRLEFEPGFPHPGGDPFPRLAEPIEIANPIYETLDQVVEILASHQAGEAPEVPSTLAPVPPG